MIEYPQWAGCGYSETNGTQTMSCYDGTIEPNAYDLELEDLERRSIARLLSAEVFDRQAFFALKNHLARKVGCMRRAAAAIRNQAAFVPEAQSHLSLADEFELLLDILIMSETPQDRVPSVPRII